MAEIQKAVSLNGKRRVETGPMQFGDDWPGVFFRGDDALAAAVMLTGLMQHVGRPELLEVGSALRGLIEQLKSCRIDDKDEAA
jgi:hypothetical protein